VIQFLRERTLLRLFWLVIALHVLNVGIDAPDARTDATPEDLTYNEMECLVEIVLEQILLIDNAISEHDEDDTEVLGGMELSEAVFYCQELPIFSLVSPFHVVPSPPSRATLANLLSRCASISLPPPKFGQA